MFVVGCSEQASQPESVEVPVDTPAKTSFNGEEIAADGYTIRVPDGWEIVDEEKTILSIRSPLEDGNDTFGENIRIVRYPLGRPHTVEEVLKRQKSDTGRFMLIGEGRVDEARVPMTWMALTPQTPQHDKDDRVKIDFMTTQGNELVVLVAMAERNAWKRYMPIFREIVSTFQPPSHQ
ncbi:MAG TPA: hypothetical protein DDW52_20320 [Planctomycetaceae bacterium]|nr:hypothetical protein [Planctomycetaceae bacterium]